MNYIDKIRTALEQKLNMGCAYSSLLDVYALLVLVRGKDCTNEDIHDAWAVWQNNIEKDHRSLIPFDELTKDIQSLDEKYRDAVIKVSTDFNL